VTTTTDFATLGLKASSIPGTVSSLESSGFAVRFDAATGAYVIDLPAQEPGNLAHESEDGSFWQAVLDDQNGIAFDRLSIFKPAPTNPLLALQYTSFGKFYDTAGWYDYDVVSAGAFAFGMATPSAAIPTTGSAVFDAIIAGHTLDLGRTVGGTASLEFNFGAGTLSGSLSPYTFTNGGIQSSLGTYTFVNTVYSQGSTTFSGDLQHAGTATLGAFNGLFTGPAAQELMAKWTAPYQNPDSNQWSEMFGILVGKKP
jgi:hypothetical protein